MFDYIKFETDCPECGAKLKNFQSKDGPCMLETLDYWEVDNFYDYCDKCGARVYYNLKEDKKPQLPIDFYEQGVDKQREDKIK